MTPALQTSIRLFSICTMRCLLLRLAPSSFSTTSYLTTVSFCRCEGPTQLQVQNLYSTDDLLCKSLCEYYCDIQCCQEPCVPITGTPDPFYVPPTSLQCVARRQKCLYLCSKSPKPVGTTLPLRSARHCARASRQQTCLWPNLQAFQNEPSYADRFENTSYPLPTECYPPLPKK